MKRSEFLRTKEYWIVQFQFMLFETLEDYLKENQLTRTQFAEKMGVTKGYVSQILNGDFDHKISKFVELLLACGKVPLITIVDLNDHIEEDALANNAMLGSSKKAIESIVHEADNCEDLVPNRSTPKKTRNKKANN